MSYEKMEQQDGGIAAKAAARITELVDTVERVCAANQKLIEECESLRAQQSLTEAREAMRDAAVAAMDDLQEGNQLHVLRFYTYQVSKMNYLDRLRAVAKREGYGDVAL